MIESVHPRKHPHFLFHMVRLYIDHEHGLPIRFEAYDWPKHPGAGPELVEEYTYLNLRTNVGLREDGLRPGQLAVLLRPVLNARGRPSDDSHRSRSSPEREWQGPGLLRPGEIAGGGVGGVATSGTRGLASFDDGDAI